VAGQVLDPESALAGYAQVFGVIGLIGIVLGVVMGAASFGLKALGHGLAEDQLPAPSEPGPEVPVRD